MPPSAYEVTAVGLSAVARTADVAAAIAASIPLVANEFEGLDLGCGPGF